MPISIAGTLQIKSISGRHGSFSVGELVTDIGSFKIKDTVLDQYQEGAYQGEFVISQIFPSSYVSWGKVITEIRATLAALNIFTDAEPVGADNDDLGEPDPISESPVPPPSAVALPQAVSPDSTSHPNSEPLPPIATKPDKPAQVTSTPVEQAANAAATKPVSDDLALFGAELMESIWENVPVKLDPTVDRQLFRQQRDRLGKHGLGWIFEPKSQTWEPPKR